MQIFTYTQTGGAGSYTDLDDSYLKNYTVKQLQVTGVSTTATVSVMGPSEQYTDVKTLSNNDIYVLEGYFEKLRIYWSDSSGGSVTLRSYNLDAIDGG
jgi:hypothetical protein